jgi:hypothetical protein
MGTTYNGGINIAFGFKLEDNSPIDDRFVVPTYADLSLIDRKYDGLLVYVQEEKKYYGYDLPNDIWEPLAGEGDGDTRLISIDSVSQNGNQFTYTNIRGEIQGNEFLDASHIENINPAADNFYRIDILVRDITGIYRIQGEESEENPLQPTLPPDTVLISVFNIFGEIITSTVPTIPNLQSVMEVGSSGIVEQNISIVSADFENDLILGVEYIKGTNLTFYKQSSEGSTGFDLAYVNQGIKIFDGINEVGLYYSGNYASNNISNPRWIPDKGYVDNAITVGTGNFVKLDPSPSTSQTIQGSIELTGDIDAFIGRFDSSISVGDEGISSMGGINCVGNITVFGQVLIEEVIPTADNHAVRKDYVDGLMSGIFRTAGNWDASGGTFPTTGTGLAGAIRRGDTYKVSVAGSMGGEAYDVGDAFYAVINNPGQTTANWARFDYNTQQATSTLRGTMFLYTSTGTATDGTMTQNAITNALNLRALDADVVHKAGVEVLTGAKTFLNASASTGAFFNNNSATSNSSALSIAASTNYGMYASSFGGSAFIKGIVAGVNTIAIDLDGANSTVGDYINIKKNGGLLSKIDYLGNITGTSFIKTGGTSSQFLKADGSVDSNIYLTSSSAIIQGGNTFGTAMTIGTNDNNIVNIEVNNTIIGNFNSGGLNVTGIIAASTDIQVAAGGQIRTQGGSGGSITMGTSSTGHSFTTLNNNTSQAYTFNTSSGHTGVHTSWQRSPSTVLGGVRNDGRVFGSDGSASNDYYTVGQATTALALKANDADVAHKAGTETFTGSKTFSAPVEIQGTNYIGFASTTWTIAHGSGGMNFTKQGTGNALFLKDNTYVGIGSNNPITKLDVWDNTSNDLITGRIGSLGVQAFTFAGYNTDSINGGLIIKTQNAGLINEVARFTHQGNMSIGVTLPMLFYNNPSEPSRVNGIYYTTDNSGYKFGIGKIVSGTKTDIITINDSNRVDFIAGITVATLNASSLPTYANEAAAITAGLATGDIYKTATGELRIKL